MRTYDAILIFLASMKEDELEGALASVRQDVERQGGEVLKTAFMGKHVFARVLKKQREGRYYRMTFRMDPARLEDFQKRLKLNTSVFRVQILKREKPLAEPEPEAERGEAAQEA